MLASINGAVANTQSDDTLVETTRRIYSGTTGTIGMGAHHEDQLIFTNGTFRSRECEKIGFNRSSFEFTLSPEASTFSAVTVSERHGTLTWHGVIRDGQIEAHYVWKKERLFWTIERQYWFRGNIDNARH